MTPITLAGVKRDDIDQWSPRSYVSLRNLCASVALSCCREIEPFAQAECQRKGASLALTGGPDLERVDVHNMSLVHNQKITCVKDRTMKTRIKLAQKKKGTGRQYSIGSPAYSAIHPTLGSQLHKNRKEQAKQSRITNGEVYKTPKDWPPPRG